MLWNCLLSISQALRTIRMKEVGGHSNQQMLSVCLYVKVTESHST